jgi:DNA repair protein RecO (recombination protein O)
MPRARAYTTEAIILRRVDFGEADRLVTLLTPDVGKLRVLAKGARKITSRKAGHIELFARTTVQLAKGRTFDLVTQAELIEPHRVLREDVSRGSLAHYLCELVEQFAPEDSEDAELYAWLSNALLSLCDANDPHLVSRYFEMRLLSLAGYRPQLFKCALTGNTLEVDLPNYHFSVTTPLSPADGGALHKDALSRAREWVSVSRSGLMLLRALQTQDLTSIQNLSVTREVHNDIERALQSYLSFVTERRMKSMTFVKQLQRT